MSSEHDIIFTFMGNSIGHIFRVTNWGESHGKAIGVVIDGCPSLLTLTEADIQHELDRRRPGQSALTTPRAEDDRVEILSGVFDGKTTGAPISLIIHNKDFNKKDYAEMKDVFRPSHAGYAYTAKYGICDPYGGGRSSARLTAGNVAAGAIAQKILKREGIRIVAYVESIQEILSDVDPMTVTRKKVDLSPVRCPDLTASRTMIDRIEHVRDEGDSVGGVIKCIVHGVAAGLGDPIFDKLEADLAKAMMNINATKGFEIGSGFVGTLLRGSEHNDEFVAEKGHISTATNNSGGVQGGISNGMPIVFRVAFKPTATIRKRQKTVTLRGKNTTIEASGRHDPCVLPRAVPIVEAMAAITLLDHFLLNKAR